MTHRLDYISTILISLALLVTQGCFSEGIKVNKPASGAPTDTGQTEVAAECGRNADCSNFIYCDGLEICDQGKCVQSEPINCDDGLGCTIDLCDELSNRCVNRPHHDYCDDTNFCNGEERCLPNDQDSNENGCVKGTPVGCNDDDLCTEDTCKENECRFTLRDLDDDGHGDKNCILCDPENPTDCIRGDDCDDMNEFISPSAQEICDDGQDNNCNLYKDYAEITCSVPNDSCEGALYLEPNVALRSSTRRTDANINSHCAPAEYRDVVFMFELFDKQDVEIYVSSRLSRTLNIALATTCGDKASDLKCSTGQQSLSQLNRTLRAGTYYVIVSTEIETDFEISYSHWDPLPRPEGDQCTSGRDISTEGTYNGTTTSCEPDYETSCGSSLAPDRTYMFTLTEASRVNLTVNAPHTVSVAVVSRCGVITDSEYSCHEGKDVAIELLSLNPGIYYVIVKSETELDFTLSIDFDITSADSCADAHDISALGTIVGTTARLTADIDTTCGTAGAPDSVYRFTLTEEQDVSVNFTSQGEAQSLTLTTECGNPSADIKCMTGEAFQLSGRGLGPGTYYLVATGTNSGANYEIELSTTGPVPVPEDSSCTGAIPITGDGSFVGDTYDCDNDYASTCGNETDVDTTYVLTLSEPQGLDITVTGNTTPVTLSVQETCGDVQTEKICFIADPTIHRYYRYFDTGTYYFIFKTALPDTFEFQVTHGPPEPIGLLPYLDNSTHTVVSRSGGYTTGQYDILISPLTFPFNGQQYDCISGSTNGYIRFGIAGTCPRSSGNTDPDTDIDEVFGRSIPQISWLGDDGHMTSGTSVTSYVDTTNQRIILTYLGYYRSGRPAPDSNNVQIILYTDTGDIQISYFNCTFGNMADHWSIGISEPNSGGVVQAHDFTEHPLGSVVAFGPGAINQFPEYGFATDYSPLNGRALYFARIGALGWNVMVDELPFE